MPKLAALASAADNICLASSSVRLAYVRGMSPHLNTCRILTSCGPGQPWAASGRSRHPLKRLDEPRRDQLVRPRVLAGDELAILDHIRLEVDRGRAHLAARDPKRIDHVEVQLGVEDALLDDLLLGNREDRHLVPGI